MKQMTIAGVPEHFNLPLIDAVAAAADMRWQAEPQGTGAMVAGLCDGSFDAALLLTEGAVAALAAGRTLSIAATWVESPLQWGIHVPAHSDIETEGGIQGRRYAISRFGSGSHLMACAHAQAAGRGVEELQFVTVGTLDGARRAFAEAAADVFFWERTMTAPLVDSGEFRRVGLFEAPWPAFVLCARDSLAAADRSRLQAVFDDACARATVFASGGEASVERVSRTYGIDATDVRAWLDRTRWASSLTRDEAMLDRVANALFSAGIIDAIPAL